MKKLIFIRVASIVLAAAAVTLLIWLWAEGHREYSFIPLLMAAAACLCLNYYKSKKK